MHISHHHPVNVSTPTPSQPTMSTPVSCMNTSIVTTSAVTTTAGAMNSPYYPAAVNNMVSMAGSPQPSAGVPGGQQGGQQGGQTGVINNTEQYNSIAATGNAGKKEPQSVLRGTVPPSFKLAYFVLYLKIMNSFLKKKIYRSYAKLFKELKKKH